MNPAPRNRAVKSPALRRTFGLAAAPAATKVVRAGGGTVKRAAAK
jgi:hypothetical protein